MAQTLNNLQPSGSRQARNFDRGHLFDCCCTALHEGNGCPVGILQLVEECPVLTASPREGFCGRAAPWSGEQSQEGLNVTGHNCWGNILVFWWTILSIGRQGLMERVSLEVSVYAW